MIDPSIWYTGSIEEAVAFAVQSGKLFFVYIARQESTSADAAWEDFFRDPQLQGVIQAEAIALRLTDGSHDADSLKSICI